MLISPHRRRSSRGPLEWWFRLTAPTFGQTTALSGGEPIDHRLQAQIRHGRMISILILPLIIGVLLGFFDEQNILRTSFLLFGFFKFIIALFVNKQGKMKLASWLVAGSSLITFQFNVWIIALQIQNSFSALLTQLTVAVLNELIFISFLPPVLVWLPTAVNVGSVILLVVLGFLPGSIAAAYTNIYVVIAIICYTLVYTLRDSITLSDHLDARLLLERTIKDQEQAHARELQYGVGLLMESMAQIANVPSQQIISDKALPPWIRQLLLSLENLRKRVARSTNQEKEYQRTFFALQRLQEVLQDPDWYTQLLQWPETRSAVDEVVRQLRASLTQSNGDGHSLRKLASPWPLVAPTSPHVSLSPIKEEQQT